ncbi:hypothetical protein C8Q77DRAFT_382912 [Trametes polyzona]|nr:hypothetical protein C8Q77DRAFT_382912 [Trametes polyzona]
MPWAPRFRSLAILVLGHLVLSSVFLGVFADPTTNATCFPSYAWMNNEKGQSPCLVAAYLLSPCSPSAAGATVPALNGSRSLYNFAGTVLDSTPCVCSTVTFSMLYACATCQGAEMAIIPYYITSENCTSRWLYSQDYPKPISPQTSVPAWAYEAFDQQTGRLDIYNAKSIASEDLPDATLAGSYWEGASPTASSQPYYSYDSGSHGVSVGLVVGATLGAVLGAIVLIAALVFIVRASRRRRRALTMRDAGSGTAGPATPPKEREECLDQDEALGSSTKLYNPDDPNTYPSIDEKVVALPHGPGDYTVPAPWESTQAKSQVAYLGTSEFSYPGRPEAA